MEVRAGNTGWLLREHRRYAYHILHIQDQPCSVYRHDSPETLTSDEVIQYVDQTYKIVGSNKILRKV